MQEFGRENAKYHKNSKSAPLIHGPYTCIAFQRGHKIIQVKMVILIHEKKYLPKINLRVYILISMLVGWK